MFFFTQKYKNQSVRPVTSRQIQQAVQKQQEDMLLIDGEDVSALRERVCIHRFIRLRNWDWKRCNSSNCQYVQHSMSRPLELLPSYVAASSSVLTLIIANLAIRK